MLDNSSMYSAHNVFYTLVACNIYRNRLLNLVIELAATAYLLLLFIL